MFKRDPDSAAIAFPPPLIFAGFLVLGLAIDRHGHAIRINDPIWGVIGWFFIAVGVGGVLWAGWMLQKAGTGIEPGKPSTAIVSSGPYRYSRNPIYVALMAIYLGTAVLFGTVWPLILAPLVKLTMDRLAIYREERYLAKKFGEDYLVYYRATPRWLFQRDRAEGRKRQR